MIDTNKLRRLAQEATPGPWEISEDHRFPGVHAWGEVVFGGSFCDYSEPIKADQAFIAAANPAAITELLDHLEETAKDIALKERIIDSIGSTLNAVSNERDALRAKVEAMEQQEPVAWTTKLALELGKDTLGFHIGIRNLWGDKGIPLYALPGAQPAPSVPECPYPCGWRNLLKHAIEDGAYLARQLNEGDPVTENARAVTRRMAMRLRDVLMAINNATPEAKP